MFAQQLAVTGALLRALPFLIEPIAFLSVSNKIPVEVAATTTSAPNSCNFVTIRRKMSRLQTKNGVEAVFVPFLGQPVTVASNFTMAERDFDMAILVDELYLQASKRLADAAETRLRRLFRRTYGKEKGDEIIQEMFNLMSANIQSDARDPRSG